MGSDFSSVEKAIEDFRQGRMVILIDDEDRENEGDLAMAAEMATPEAINFMAREGRGLICLTLTEERADRLELPPMVSDNTCSFGTAFTVSIEARTGVTTGISAADRARTIQVAVAEEKRGFRHLKSGDVEITAAVDLGTCEVHGVHRSDKCQFTRHHVDLRKPCKGEFRSEADPADHRVRCSVGIERQAERGREQFREAWARTRRELEGRDGSSPTRFGIDLLK